MPRRGFVPKREVLDDPMYGGKVVTKLINQVMLDGKRGTAQKACYGAFEIIREKTGREPIEYDLHVPVPAVLPAPSGTPESR